MGHFSFGWIGPGSSRGIWRNARRRWPRLTARVGPTWTGPSPRWTWTARCARTFCAPRTTRARQRRRRWPPVFARWRSRPTPTWRGAICSTWSSSRPGPTRCAIPTGSPTASERKVCALSVVQHVYECRWLFLGFYWIRLEMNPSVRPDSHLDLPSSWLDGSEPQVRLWSDGRRRDGDDRRTVDQRTAPARLPDASRRHRTPNPGLFLLMPRHFGYLRFPLIESGVIPWMSAFKYFVVWMASNGNPFLVFRMGSTRSWRCWWTRTRAWGRRTRSASWSTSSAASPCASLRAATCASGWRRPRARRRCCSSSGRATSCRPRSTTGPSCRCTFGANRLPDAGSWKSSTPATSVSPCLVLRS